MNISKRSCHFIWSVSLTIEYVTVLRRKQRIRLVKKPFLFVISLENNIDWVKNCYITKKNVVFSHSFKDLAIRNSTRFLTLLRLQHNL